MNPSSCSWALMSLLVATGCSAPTSSSAVPSSTRVLQRPDTLVAPGTVFDTVAIQVRDASGRPVTGVLLEWSGDGEITAFASRTDDVGVARARWLLPGREVLGNWGMAPRTGPSGSFSIVAQVPGLGATTITVRAQAFEADVVSATEYYACGLRSHELWCWGDVWPLSPEGEDRLPRRVSLPGGLEPRALRAASSILCLLDNDGLPFCALPTFGDRFDRILESPPLRMLAHSRTKMCGLAETDGSVWCWNSGYLQGHGQSAVRLQAGPFIDLAGGSDVWCGLTADGVAWCWGANDRGQLGDGTTTPRAEAAPVSSDARFTSIAAGAKRACGSTATGEVWCWGWAGGTAENVALVPVRIEAPGVAGPVLDVGEAGEIYMLDGERLRVHGEAADFFTEIFGEQRIRQFSVDILGCLINVDGEVHCSWEMLINIISHNWGPGAPVPVPPVPDGS
jgi:hypothetical protein